MIPYPSCGRAPPRLLLLACVTLSKAFEGRPHCGLLCDSQAALQASITVERAEDGLLYEPLQALLYLGPHDGGNPNTMLKKTYGGASDLGTMLDGQQKMMAQYVRQAIPIGSGNPMKAKATAPPMRTMIVFAVTGAVLLVASILMPWFGDDGNSSTKAEALPDNMLRSTEESFWPLAVLCRFVIRFRIFIILFWLGAAVAGGFGTAKMTEILHLDFKPTEGMPSHTANKHFEEVFPARARGADFALLLEVPRGESVTKLAGLDAFAKDFREKLNSTGNVLDFTSYPTLLREHGINSGSQLVLANDSLTIIQWVIKDPSDSKAASTYAWRVHEILDDLIPTLPGLSFHGVVAFPEMVNVSMEACEKYVRLMDAVVLPIAALVLCWVVRSARLMLILLATLGTSMTTSFGALYLLSYATTVDSITPSIMTSVCIAMNIDYSLFILTRFKEEIVRQDADAGSGSLPAADLVNRSVIVTMQTAGFVCCSSGSIMMATFLALVAFPVGVIASSGLGSAIALFLSVCINLTLSPAILSAFPNFFAGCIDRGGPSPQQPSKAFSTVWTWIAQVTTSFPRNLVVIVALVMLTLAIGLCTLRLSVQNDFRANNARGTQAFDTFNHLLKTFGAGGAFPFKVMLEAPGGGSVFNAEFWGTSQRILRELARVLPGGKKATKFHFISSVDGIDIPWMVASECLGANDMLSQAAREVCTRIRYLRGRFVNDEGTAAWGYARTTFDPLGKEGIAWLSQFRSLAQAWQQSTGVKISVVGVAADNADIIDKVYRIFPWMVLVTLGIVLLLMSLLFRSVLIPVRSVCSIALTMLFVYGLAVLTYQDGLFEWTRLPGLSPEFHGTHWVCPVICFSILVGICLDYDIFLVSRITELHQAGKGSGSMDTAIQQGVCCTGGIISAAGVIMAIAFAGQLFASLPPVNGIGFFMTAATLYDTFLVRPLFTPAAMSIVSRCMESTTEALSSFRKKDGEALVKRL